MLPTVFLRDALSLERLAHVVLGNSHTFLTELSAREWSHRVQSHWFACISVQILCTHIIHMHEECYANEWTFANPWHANAIQMDTDNITEVCRCSTSQIKKSLRICYAVPKIWSRKCKTHFGRETKTKQHCMLGRLKGSMLFGSKYVVIRAFNENGPREPVNYLS